MIFSILSATSLFIIKLIENTGYFGITILMVLESADIPIPSEVIMPFSGFIIFSGQLSFLPVVLCGAFGNVLGSLLGYSIGYFGGRPFIEKYGKYLLISSDETKRAEKWFSRYGLATIFFGRMLPIVRTFISTPAGVAKMDLKKFSLFTFLGALPWCALLTFVGLRAGKNWQILEPYFRKFDIVIAIIIIFLIIWWAIKRIKILKSFK